MLRPEGKLGSYQAALDSFVVRRNRNIEFVKTTQADFRNHYCVFPGFGWLMITRPFFSWSPIAKDIPNSWKK